MIPKTTTDAVNYLILALMIGGSVFVYGNLPERIPIHYGIDGTPDRFAGTSWLSWMLLPGLAVLLTAMMYGIGRLLYRWPDQLNTPHQKAYRALPPEAKRVVIADQEQMLAIVTLGMNVMFAVLQYRGYLTATGQAEGLGWISWGAIVGFTVATLALCIRAVAKTGDLIKRLSAEA